MLSARASVFCLVFLEVEHPQYRSQYITPGESHFPIHIGIHPLVSYMVGELAMVHRKDQQL